MASHPLGATDFSPYITKIMAAKPDVLITVSAGRDQVNSWKQLREFGAFEKMKVCGTVLYFSNVLGVGVDAFGEVTARPHFIGRMSRKALGSRGGFL